MAEEKNPDVTITMRVDCSGLTSDENPKNNITKYINLRDTLHSKQDVKGHVETFDTIVLSEAVIVWEGKSSDGMDSVHITKVYENEGEVNCFQKAPYQNSDGSEDWTAIALDVDKLGDRSCEYSIDFTINGGKTVFTLDPKLQIKKRI